MSRASGVSSPTTGNNHGATGFVDNADYYRYDSRSGLPESWKQYTHPNGTMYYYNSGMRLLTRDDIQDPVVRANVVSLRNDYYEDLADDPDFFDLPGDWVMTVTDSSDSGSGVMMIHSRTLGRSYGWSKRKGLVARSKEYFWSHMAEYPSHLRHIPHTIEQEFQEALVSVREGLETGVDYPLTAPQLEQVIRRYNLLKALQSQGNDSVLSALTWLIGAVMPLDPVKEGDPRIDDDLITALMGKVQ